MDEAFARLTQGLVDSLRRTRSRPQGCNDANSIVADRASGVRGVMSSSLNERHDRDDRRANPLGAYIATAGALVLLVSIWLDWLGLGPGDSEQDPSSGYEGDGVIPLLAYLGVGFALALLYATKRADRRQHRGLSLASFAVGLAALLWAVSYIIDPISTLQYPEGNVSVKWGAYIGVLGALLWTLGSFLLAKEPEGDFEQTRTAVAHPVATHVETQRVDTGTRHTGTTVGEHDLHRTTDRHDAPDLDGREQRPTGY